MDDRAAAVIGEDLEREIARDLFNRVWRLLESPSRTRGQDDEMLHAAHASRHHWARVGTAANIARGEWQCSRVYAVLGRPEPSLHHARRCLDVCLQHPDAMADFDQPYAHEALARAYALAGDAKHAGHHAARARELGAAIADAEDRDLFATDLATLPALVSADPTASG